MGKLSDSYGRVNVTVFICVSLLPVLCLFRNRTYGTFSFCRKKVRLWRGIWNTHVL